MTVTMSLKLISFHHVMEDVRSLVGRVIAAKQEGKKIEVNAIEGTLLGVNSEVYNKALTYPHCLKANEFIRFLFAPTCCYQLIYPLKPKRNWENIAYRFLQMTIGSIFMAYIFAQHVLPICKESVHHFRQGDDLEILISVLNASIPCSYLWLTFFFVLFHALTNFAAEVTRFSDCRFYSDWWNAGNLAEFWRKWNYPIHNWLVRHIYYPLIRRKMD